MPPAPIRIMSRRETPLVLRGFWVLIVIRLSMVAARVQSRGGPSPGRHGRSTIPPLTGAINRE